MSTLLKRLNSTAASVGGLLDLFMYYFAHLDAAAVGDWMLARTQALEAVCECECGCVGGCPSRHTNPVAFSLACLFDMGVFWCVGVDDLLGSRASKQCSPHHHPLSSLLPHDTTAQPQQPATTEGRPRKDRRQEQRERTRQPSHHFYVLSAHSIPPTHLHPHTLHTR